MADFRFDEADHSYWLGEQRLDAVTHVLREAGMIDASWFTEEARTRGAYVHQATEMIDRGTLDWDALDPILSPYCRAYERFVADVRPEVLLSERPLYHAGYLYAGTPDRVARINGITAVVDFSTGDPLPAKLVQVAAYREMVLVSEDIGASQGFTLWLKNDGSYRLSPPMNLKEMRRNLQIFLAALSVVRWRRENA